jgi:hypothetical protein
VGLVPIMNGPFPRVVHRQVTDNSRELIGLPTASSKKWTFDLPVLRACSRR